MDSITIFKVVFSLFVVVGLLFFFSYLLKNYILKFIPASKTDDIKLRDVKFLSKDKALVSFEFDGRIFLIGFDNNSITKLYEREVKKDESS
ncbi:MAG: hypothetical protein ABWJ98_06565 [Hydrogenothermaceae bacterium]